MEGRPLKGALLIISYYISPNPLRITRIQKCIYLVEIFLYAFIKTVMVANTTQVVAQRVIQRGTYMGGQVKAVTI